MEGVETPEEGKSVQESERAEKSLMGKLLVEQKAEREWDLILKSVENRTKKWREVPGIKEKISRGIPDPARPLVWKLLLREHRTISYRELTKKPCEYRDQIIADVRRTAVTKKIKGFKTDEELRKTLEEVLIGVVNAIPSVGYCQGMNDIAAALLSFFGPEDALGVFLSLIFQEKLHGLFDKNLSMLAKVVERQRRVLECTVPGILIHFSSENVDLVFCVAKWYLTLFCRFPSGLRERIWDFLFFYGFKTLAHFVSAILLYYEKDILSLRAEALLSELGNFEKRDFDPDIVVMLALRSKKSYKKRKNKILFNTL